MSYSPDEVMSVCNFLKQTPEGSLRKMLVDAKLTDAHFRLLMKLAKGGSEEDFIEAFQNESMGKLRLNAKEMPLKEVLWGVCKAKLVTLGLLPARAEAAKAA
ncbi:MAG: hypothetical protein KDD38_11060 [Bdellovibrionales bacterium]|nr:hypothetical protein [Bdellovibrionales bacterium]